METKVCKICGEEKPIEMFMTNKLGTSCVCKDCMNKKKSEKRAKKKDIEALQHELLNVKNMRLADFESNELLYELKRRGYVGSLEFVKRVTVNLDNYS